MLQERQFANLAFGNGVSGHLHSAIPLLRSLFRAGLVRSGLARLQPSFRSDTLTTFVTRSQPRLRPAVALTRVIASRPTLTRLFFPAKNSCDQTSDLEIVKEEDAPLRPLRPPTHNPVSESHHS